MKKQFITEAARLQKLAGINEARVTPVSTAIPLIKITISMGELDDDEETEAKYVQILFYDKKEDDWIDVDMHPKFEYLNSFGAGTWTMEPLEQYDGEYDYIYNGNDRIYEFNTAKEVEDFMKNDLRDELQDF